MMRVPVKFQRVAAAFDKVARVRSCESSGSEHPADLSDLVNSFFETEIRDQGKNEKADQHENGNEIDDDDDDDDELERNSQDLESRDSLKNLFDLGNDDAFKRSVHAEVEKAYREISSSLPDFNRRLMAQLRSRGLDAGLCKVKWEKNGRCPSGDYEYVDVNGAGSRYIIEVFPAEEFTIARPSGGYAALLEVFPTIYVGKPEELKKVVRLMCTAIRRSMKAAGIHVPPWRRLTYMQSKWFGSYKRTINETPIWKAPNVGGNQRVGFVPVQGISFYCREDFAAKAGVRIGNLAAVLNQKEMLL